MKIAVLAWGSLIWDQRDLTLAGCFTPGGPLLPIEFCRVSDDGRLTLVIDEIGGAPCSTYFAESGHSELDVALQNLWLREGKGEEVPPRRIRTSGRVGYVMAASEECGAKALERHPTAVVAIKAWTQANGYDATIWTALGSNFNQPDKAGEPFSMDAAMRYLERLEKPNLGRALDYFRSAPPEVQTPVRRAASAKWSVAKPACG